MSPSARNRTRREGKGVEIGKLVISHFFDFSSLHPSPTNQPHHPSLPRHPTRWASGRDLILISSLGETFILDQDLSRSNRTQWPPSGGFAALPGPASADSGPARSGSLWPCRNLPRAAAESDGGDKGALNTLLNLQPHPELTLSCASSSAPAWTRRLKQRSLFLALAA